MTVAIDTRNIEKKMIKEDIKLELIKNQTPQSLSHSKKFMFSQEAIRNMVKALEFSDATLSNEIETFLVCSGEKALSEVVLGLNSSNLNVKSTCAMVMIRIGAPSIQVINAFYQAHRHPEALRWVVEFILGELGETVPQLTVDSRWDDKVVALGCAV